MEKSVLPTMAHSQGDMTLDDILDILKSGGEVAKSGAHAAWSRTTKRMRVGIGIICTLYVNYPLSFLSSHQLISTLSFFFLTILSPSVPSTSDLPKIPTISLDYNSGLNPTSRYNSSKVALLIENRSNPILAPLMLHFMSVVPPDWRFRFMGSFESVAFVNQSRAVRDAVSSGKLDLTYIPANMTTGSQEEISQFLTTLWIYETVLAPAEWLLVYQTDSMLCANSRQSLNSYLEYDWVGAPWNPKGRFGGNGGLSLRKVSSIVDVLRNQKRPVGGEPEDVWLTDRLGHRPNARLANGTASLVFSGEMFAGKGEHLLASKLGAKKKPGHDTNGDELVDVDGDGLLKGIDDWRDGFYEPMGYHTGGSGVYLHAGIWGTPALRRHIWGYCPEIKITLKMDAKKYVPGDCKSNWKRDLGATGGALGVEGEEVPQTEIIDGVEYPMLPAGLMGW